MGVNYPLKDKNCDGVEWWEEETLKMSVEKEKEINREIEATLAQTEAAQNYFQNYLQIYYCLSVCFWPISELELNQLIFATKRDEGK